MMEELDSFLDTVEDILPLSTTQWESVVETHSARYPDKGQTVDSLKRKYKELHIKRIPTGDPHCPPAVCRAKQLRNAIIELMDGSDLNSPAWGTRMDAPRMGGESGESFGGSDDDADNQEYEDTGVENAPTERTIDSSDAPTGDKQAPRLPVTSRGQRGSTAQRGATNNSSTANSSNNGRRTSTHNTPILRPRNRQRENSPEDPGDRVQSWECDGDDDDESGSGLGRTARRTRRKTPRIPSTSRDAASADSKSAEHDGYDYDEYDGSECFRFSSK